ncbi:MAG: type III pantothenate kinase [Phycisphaeraceae bacterium]|nr:type III pantothenate kinase [Phycisphaeraceae bacterium]
MSPDVFLALAIGNTRARAGRFEGAVLHDARSLSVDPSEIVEALRELAGDREAMLVATSSVNGPAAEAIERRLAGEPVLRFALVRRDLPIDLQHSLDDDRTVGTDRLVCAIGAFGRARQACIVIDAGTAITVDFVDGEGGFHGGAIAPGVRMMLTSLHEHTASLPLVEIGSGDEPTTVQGKDTPGAIRLGVLCAARGLVHHLIDRYAEAYGAYPQIVATGGDAGLLFSSDPLIEHVVPDLQLLGIERIVRDALDEADD